MLDAWRHGCIEAWKRQKIGNDRCIEVWMYGGIETTGRQLNGLKV